MFADRRHAGRVLSEALVDYRGRSGLLVLGLARGGLPVAAEVATALGAELDVAVVRKLGAPGHEELALGAIAGERMVLNDHLMRSLGVSEDSLAPVIDRERRELARRETAYRSGRPPADPTGRTVILVDDGLATGASMRAAVLSVRDRGAAQVVVAVPTAPASAVDEFAGIADDFVCPDLRRDFMAVGYSYRDFHQVDDDEVRTLLNG